MIKAAFYGSTSHISAIRAFMNSFVANFRRSVNEVCARLWLKLHWGFMKCSVFRLHLECRVAVVGMNRCRGHHLRLASMSTISVDPRWNAENHFARRPVVRRKVCRPQDHGRWRTIFAYSAFPTELASSAAGYRTSTSLVSCQITLSASREISDWPTSSAAA